jgi:hypothetical protein
MYWPPFISTIWLVTYPLIGESSNGLRGHSIPPSRFIDLDHFEGWFGVVAPRGTSNAAIERVNKDLGTVFALPDIVERFDTLGVLIALSDHARALVVEFPPRD